MRGTEICVVANVNFGAHFEAFVKQQIEHGRFQNASEVVRAGLRLLEDHESSRLKTRERLKREINEAFDDPRPSIPAETVFDRLERRAGADIKAHRRAS